MGVIGTVLVPWESMRRESFVRYRTQVELCSIASVAKEAMFKKDTPFSRRIRCESHRCGSCWNRTSTVVLVQVAWESPRRESFVRYHGISVGVGLCSIASGAKETIFKKDRVRELRTWELLGTVLVLVPWESVDTT